MGTLFKYHGLWILIIEYRCIFTIGFVSYQLNRKILPDYQILYHPDLNNNHRWDVWWMQFMLVSEKKRKPFNYAKIVGSQNS